MAWRNTVLLLLALTALTAASLQTALATSHQINQQTGDKLYIVTTLPVIADIIKNIAGEYAVVESLVKPGINIASYDITPRDSAKMAEADIFIYVGYGAEEVLGIYAESIRDGAPVFKLLDHIPDADAEEPYFWLDPMKVEKLSWKITEALSQVDPGNAENYIRNTRAFSEKLRELDAWIMSRVGEIPPEKRKIISVRDTLSHFASRYGLEVVGYVTAYAGTYEPQSKSVTELADRAVKEQVSIFFIEYEESATTLREVVETVADEINVETVEFIYIESLAPQHGVRTYIDLMRRNTETIVNALTQDLDKPSVKQTTQSIFPINLLLEPFKYEFMQRGLVTLLFVVVAAALVGSFAVLRGWAIFGDALAHGGVAGLVMAYLIRIDYFLGALISGLFVALAVSTVEKKTRLRTDVIIAFTFTSMFALAIVILSYMGGVTVSIEDILFADVTAVSVEMMQRTLITTSLVMVFALTFRKALLIYTVDPVMASSMGFRTTAIHYGLLIILAVAIISAFMTIGAIPAIASLIIPPAAAFISSRTPTEFITKSVAIAVASSFAGLYISYYVNTNVGAATILVAALIFIILLLARRR
ncbi:MAG TPA: hypothetical protein EYH45_03135 [Candidatus Caldiarchaeum subterraneum]|uniref:Uncharacterized protein n=1 Tax=Caldiarchaeum subterraneum TaxID=311458 RepID=A0A833A3P0_CALS0|nr:hypothetical protein [Candidatus Caldarchaeum subterraneum]